MEKVKNFVNVLVMLYLVLAFLNYLDIINFGQQTNPGFYTNFLLAGGALMLLELIIENIYILQVKRGQLHYQRTINELKAALYDQKQENQAIVKKHNEESAVFQARQQVPPQARYPQDPPYQPVLTPFDPEITITPAPLPPSLVNPADYQIKNTDSDSDTHREPNH